MPTARTLITDALIEIGVVGETQAPSGADAARALRILNRDVMDKWNASRQFSTGRVFTQGTFAASTATRTIGPSGGGSFVLTPRPIELLSASRIDANNYAYPINLRDSAWWARLYDPTFESTYITDIYYDPGNGPNGTMRPWPIPDASQTVRVESLAILSSFSTLDSSLDFAPAYESAVSETLKELFCRAWHRPYPEGLREAARDARASIQIQNVSRPRRLQTDAPSTVIRVGSDIEAFRTRTF